MKKIFIVLLLVQFSAHSQVESILNKITESGLSNTQISDGLKEALEEGITQQVTKLAGENGFYDNSLVKIGLPSQLQKVDKTLRSAGLGSLADQGIKALNSAATDAVGEAIPIFTNAITSMSFSDATSILAGGEYAATDYLKSATTSELYEKFNPIIKTSFQKVGADKIWKTIIDKYNGMPFTKDVNPDLTDYVTTEALDGVFTMVGVEEKEIREKVGGRTTELLQKVFAAQDPN